MLNLKKLLHISEKKEIVDERIEQQDTKILSQAGMLLIVLSVFDVIVRGFVLDLPIAYWAASFIYILVYSGFYFIRSSSLGIYNAEIENEKELNKKMKSYFWESVASAVFFIIFLMFLDGVPNSASEWGEYGLKFVIIVFIFQATEWIFSKKSLKKNKSN